MSAAKEVSFPTRDDGVVFADEYGAGEHAVVLAHGMRFDRSSWAEHAQELGKAGFRVVAIDFRGYGKSSAPVSKDYYLDVLAAIRYFRESGAKTIGVIGGSMGGGASAQADVEAGAGAIDRLILMAPEPIEHSERLSGAKLFIVSEYDPIAPRVKEQYERAPEPKKLVVLEGRAHAQFIFKTENGPRVMDEILSFLKPATR